MPLSLFQPRALRAFTPFSTTRLFSSTSTISAPPRQPAPSSINSTSQRLGSIMNDRSTARSGRPSGNDAAERMLTRHRTRILGDSRRQLESAEKVREAKVAKDLLKQMPRRWQAGDVYAPHDLSSNEMLKWKKKTPRVGDVVDALNLSPLDMYKNFSLIRHFTSTSGQILHSRATKLRPVNQRKVAKMIRRAQGMGLYPSIHAHPEMLRSEFFPNHRY